MIVPTGLTDDQIRCSLLDPTVNSDTQASEAEATREQEARRAAAVESDKKREGRRTAERRSRKQARNAELEYFMSTLDNPISGQPVHELVRALALIHPESGHTQNDINEWRHE